jgi:hypothetical protein
MPLSPSDKVAPAAHPTGLTAKESADYDAIPIEYRIKAIDEYRVKGGKFYTGVGEDGETEEWTDIRNILPIAQRLWDESKSPKDWKGGRKTRRRRHRRRTARR